MPGAASAGKLDADAPAARTTTEPTASANFGRTIPSLLASPNKGRLLGDTESSTQDGADECACLGAARPYASGFVTCSTISSWAEPCTTISAVPRKSFIASASDWNASE